VTGGLVVLALTVGAARLRSAALAVALVALLVAPAAWSFQTLGHATSSTFPAGGSATASGGFGGPGGGAGARFGGPPPGAAAGGMRGGFGPGGPGGNSQSVTQALAYAKAHGGGTIAVSSQQGASGTIIESGANVAALGGFSGRESEVSVSWLAQAVKDGKIRWVIAESSAGPGQDGRVGASKLMTAVAVTCKKTPVSGLYDCQGYAPALASYGGSGS